VKSVDGHGAGDDVSTGDVAPLARGSVADVSRAGHLPMSAASRDAAVRIVGQTVQSERLRRRAYWVALGLMGGAGLYLVSGDMVEDIPKLWGLCAVFAIHLVLHLWAGVRNRARLAHHASEEVLDDGVLLEAMRLVQRDRIPPATAVREVDRRRSLRPR
jgi:hypothetical protein